MNMLSVLKTFLSDSLILKSQSSIYLRNTCIPLIPCACFLVCWIYLNFYSSIGVLNSCDVKILMISIKYSLESEERIAFCKGFRQQQRKKKKATQPNMQLYSASLPPLSSLLQTLDKLLQLTWFCAPKHAWFSDVRHQVVCVDSRALTHTTVDDWEYLHLRKNYLQWQLLKGWK